MSYPALFTTPGVKAFAEAVDAERQHQLAKWGEQRHPDIDPRDIGIVTRDYFRQKAEIHRAVNEERATPSRTRIATAASGPPTSWINSARSMGTTAASRVPCLSGSRRAEAVELRCGAWRGWRALRRSDGLASSCP